MKDLNSLISTILKHDRKQNSYKIALLRAINDAALAFPDLRDTGLDVAIPLRMLAEFWLAYYWPFVEPAAPVLQGARAQGKSDMSFRRSLTSLREIWQQDSGMWANPADGFFLINELRIPRKQAEYSKGLRKAYRAAIRDIADAIRQPIQYAGPGNWSVFDRPAPLSSLSNVISLPGTNPSETCLVVKSELWQTFHELSLWVEALCIHEWCLFSERVEQPDGKQVDRGLIYVLLTARPDNRRPLTWERNQVDLLLMEGREFVCPWTEKTIRVNTPYALDHLIPVAIYPINEVWNLVPSDPVFNSQVKSDKLPSIQRLERAKPHITRTYGHYESSPALAQALREEVRLRFALLQSNTQPEALAEAAVGFITSVANARNWARF